MQQPELVELKDKFFMLFADSVYVFCCQFNFVLNSKMVITASRMKKQYQFWMAFNALRWPTDFVSFGQVEVIDFVYVATYLSMINSK